jgi:hypothetical protein
MIDRARHLRPGLLVPRASLTYGKDIGRRDAYLQSWVTESAHTYPSGKDMHLGLYDMV